MGVWREEGDAPTSCYCCWLAGVGGMPPCSWCTDPNNYPEGEEPEEPEETAAERYDRVKKELLG
jgi:hypothetical protein